jgi:hypothetical protein
MQYKHNHAEVESGGLGETAGMGIVMSAKMFRALIDTTYSRKIEAPIRELSTNAFDGHLAVGKIEAFDVHLPTMLDPTFWVRDRGCSMTHEMVMTRYKNLGDSTKDGMNAADAAVVAPNNQVGSLGFGSKAGFAYTDAFSLTCWLDGEVRVYHCFIGANGRPNVSLAHRGPSDEPTGVKVELAVRPSDIEDFEEAAIRVFKGFNVVPNGLSSNAKEEIQMEPVQIGSNWKCYSSSYLGQGFFAKQGCVIYPIDLDQINDLPAGFKNLSLSVVLDFPIGSIEYITSREFLAYTPDTIASLQAHFDSFRADIEREAKSLFASTRNRFERAAMVGGHDLFKANRFAFLTSAFQDRAAIQQAFDTFLPRDKRDAAYNGHKNPALCAIDSNGERVRLRQYTFAGGSFPDKVALILVDEVNKLGNLRINGLNARISQWLSKNGLKYAYVLAKLPEISLLREAGFPPITRLSSLPQPPKVARCPQDYVGGGFSRFKIGGEAADQDEIPDDAVFLFMRRGNYLSREGGHLKPGQLESLRLNAKLLMRPIVTINTRLNDKLERWEGYDLLYDYNLTENIDALDADQVTALIAKLNERRFNESDLSSVVSKLDQYKVLKRTPFASLKRFANAAERAERKHAELLELFSAILDCDDDPDLHHIIERGRVFGLEMLAPTPGYIGRGNRYWRAPYEPHLLPEGTQDFCHLVQNNCFDAADLNYLTKELFSK